VCPMQTTWPSSQNLNTTYVKARGEGSVNAPHESYKSLHLPRIIWRTAAVEVCLRCGHPEQYIGDEHADEQCA
jgi:hypothetical protein